MLDANRRSHLTTLVIHLRDETQISTSIALSKGYSTSDGESPRDLSEG